MPSIICIGDVTASSVLGRALFGVPCSLHCKCQISARRDGLDGGTLIKTDEAGAVVDPDNLPIQLVHDQDPQ